MASARKPVGRIKLPSAFAQMGLQIDPSRLKPNAWQNREKHSMIRKGGLPPPSIEESTQDPIDSGIEINACAESESKLVEIIIKPVIPKSIRRKKKSSKRQSLIIPKHTFMKKEDDSSTSSANSSSESSNDETSSNNDEPQLQHLDDLKIKYERNKLLISSQLQTIEALKTDKLILEEWKTSVGIIAVETVCKLENKIEAMKYEASNQQLKIEGLETETESLSQQIGAYQDEIEKFEKEKIPKQQTQIEELQALINEETMIRNELQSKEDDLCQLKIEFEAYKIGMQNNECELQLFRKENDEIKNENEQYLVLLDKLREQEVKLKKQVNDQQLEIQQISSLYTDTESKLRKETVETREQLQVATHFANELGDQLEEIRNYKKGARRSNKAAAGTGTDSDSSDVSEGIGFGRPLFEKRKTLKIMAYEHSLKLPNMMDMIENMQMLSNDDDDEEEEEEEEQLQDNISKLQSKALAPVNEFEFDVNDEKINEFDSENEQQEDDENKRYKESFAGFVAKNTNEGNVSNVSEDKIDKILRRISGSSYHKFRKGNNKMMALDHETRSKLKNEIVSYIESLNVEYEKEAKESGEIIVKYKQESKEWETKYKCLKREIKKRKLKNAQNIQKVQDPVIGGCKFWNWGGSLTGFQQKWVDLQKGFIAVAPANEANTKTMRFFVPDDSDDTDSNHANTTNTQQLL